MNKILTWIYQWFRSLRYSFLASQAGAVSHCHHYPTCGTYSLKQVEENGIFIGGWNSLKRVSSCWLLPSWRQND